MWNRCNTIHIKTGPLCKQWCNSITAAWELGLMRTQINGYDLAERAEDVERGARRGSGCPACCPSGPAVTGLSQPREKVTRQTAQWGVINVRPSPSTMVMADKLFSGSSCSHSTPGICVLCSFRRGKQQDQQQSNKAVLYGATHPTVIQKHFHHKEQKNFNISVIYTTVYAVFSQYIKSSFNI